MIYLRLRIEPVFHAPTEQGDGYCADVMFATEDIDEALPPLSDLLREGGWRVMGLSEAQLGIELPDLHEAPELHHLFRQANARGRAYRIDRGRSDASETIRVHLRTGDEFAGQSASAGKLDPERTTLA